MSGSRGVAIVNEMTSRPSAGARDTLAASGVGTGRVTTVGVLAGRDPVSAIGVDEGTAITGFWFEAVVGDEGVTAGDG